jgi:hypothetical protein
MLNMKQWSIFNKTEKPLKILEIFVPNQLKEVWLNILI